MPGDDVESFVLAAFQLVQSGWGSVVDDTEVKGSIDLEELIFHPAPPFGGQWGEYSTLVRNCGKAWTVGDGICEGSDTSAN